MSLPKKSRKILLVIEINKKSKLKKSNSREEHLSEK